MIKNFAREIAQEKYLALEQKNCALTFFSVIQRQFLLTARYHSEAYRGKIRGILKAFRSNLWNNHAAVFLISCIFNFSKIPLSFNPTLCSRLGIFLSFTSATYCAIAEGADNSGYCHTNLGSFPASPLIPGVSPRRS